MRYLLVAVSCMSLGYLLLGVRPQFLSGAKGREPCVSSLLVR